MLILSRLKRALCILLAVPALLHGAVGDVLSKLRLSTEARSPEISLAEAELRQKEGQVHTAWARWAPRLDLVLAQSKMRDYSLLVSGQLPPGFTFTPPEINLSSWTVRATVPIYRRSVHLAVEQSGDERELARTRLSVKKAEIDWRVRQLFGAYLLQCYKVATLDSSIRLAEAHLKEADLRFSLGQRTKIDVLRAQAQLTSLQSKKLQMEETRAGDRSSLEEYVGLNALELAATGIDELLADERSLEEAIESLSVDADALPKVQNAPENWTEQSPVYRAIVAEEEAALSKAESLTAQEYPELAFQAQLFQQARRWDDLFGGRNESYNIGLTLTIPLFLGGSLYSSFVEQNAARHAARLRRERDWLKLRNDVANQRLQIKALEGSVKALSLSKDQYEEILRLSQKSYDLGRVTALELQTSQNELIDAKINHAKARVDLAVLVRRYAFNLGVWLP